MLSKAKDKKLISGKKTVKSNIRVFKFLLITIAKNHAKPLNNKILTKYRNCLIWAGADSNCQLIVYQTSTLPLSYTPYFGVEGLEPSMAVPKTAALPLGYTPAKILPT